jgi:hypothetical protein
LLISDSPYIVHGKSYSVEDLLDKGRKVKTPYKAAVSPLWSTHSEAHMNWDKIFDVIVNKLHIILAAICQGTIFLMSRNGHDIGPGVQNTVYAYYAFLAGHNLTNQKYPDPPSSNGHPTDINVNVGN